MRATAFVAALAITSASATSILSLRQYEGCEDTCAPMRGWAFGCRTDRVQCMNDCTAELLDVTDACYECIKEKNPGSAESIGQYVAQAHNMCGSVRPASSSGAAESASATESAAESAAASASAAESAAASESAAPTESSAAAAASSAAGSASASESAAATSAGAAASGSPAPSAPAATSAAPASSAGKFGVSLGAVAVAVSAFLF